MKTWIELTPRFEHRDGMSFFAGYNQTAGTHYFDNSGEKYRFTTQEEFNEMKNIARDLALFVASLQIEHRFNKAENEWANRCLKPYNDFHASQATITKGEE